MFDTIILEIHLIQAELWQILCSSSPKFVTMATKGGSMVKKIKFQHLFVRTCKRCLWCKGLGAIS